MRFLHTYNAIAFEKCIPKPQLLTASKNLPKNYSLNIFMLDLSTSHL